MTSRSDFIIVLCEEFRLSITCNSVIISAVSLLMPLAVLVCPQSFTFCTDALLQCFPNFLSKNLSRWTTILPGELTESQMIFIHIAIALHIPSLEITLPLYAIAFLFLHALMSSKIVLTFKILSLAWLMGEWLTDWESFLFRGDFSGLFANSGSSDGYFLYQLRLLCIFELCFANINGAVLFIIVAIVHAHPVSCPPAAPKDLCSTSEITLNYITGVKYEKMSFGACTAFTCQSQTVT